jgi:hypothetical protein
MGLTLVVLVFILLGGTCMRFYIYVFTYMRQSQSQRGGARAGAGAGARARAGHEHQEGGRGHATSHGMVAGPKNKGLSSASCNSSQTFFFPGLRQW